MADKPATTPNAFSEALAKLVAVPRAEMQRRLAEAPQEQVNKHKRFKYVPAETPANVFERADACRRENIVLRSILKKMGLSHSAIQSRVRRALKEPDLDETGAQAVKRACEETLKRYLDDDAQQLLAKIDPIGPVQ